MPLSNAVFLGASSYSLIVSHLMNYCARPARTGSASNPFQNCCLSTTYFLFNFAVPVQTEIQVPMVPNPANFKYRLLTTPQSKNYSRSAARINLTRLAFCGISQPVLAMCEFLGCHCYCKSSSKPCFQRFVVVHDLSVAEFAALQWSTHNICRHGFCPMLRLCFTIIKLSEHEIYLPSALCRLHKSMCAMSNGLEW